MTDETPSSDGNRKERPVAGQRLAAARKASEISIFEIAKELHLDELKVQALEENRFDLLGAPVFAKGHLRKYAQLVDVDIDDVMTDYYSLTRAEGAPPVVVAARKRSPKLPPGPWLLVGGFLVVIIAAYLFWPARSVEPDAEPAAETADRAPSTPVETENVSDSVTASPEADRGTAPAAEPTPLVDDAGLDDDVPVQVSVQPEPVPARAAPAAGGSEVRLSMRFSGDCWTEITDATGARLFFDLGRSGRTVNVTGVPPIRVLFGDGDNVELNVDGDARPIRAVERRGRTARFTIPGR